MDTGSQAVSQVRVIGRSYALAILVLTLVAFVNFALLRLALHSQEAHVRLSLDVARQAQSFAGAMDTARVIVTALQDGQLNVEKLEPLQSRLRDRIADFRIANGRVLKSLDDTGNPFWRQTAEAQKSLYFHRPFNLQHVAADAISQAKVVSDTPPEMLLHGVDWTPLLHLLNAEQPLQSGFDRSMRAIDRDVSAQSARLEMLQILIIVLTFTVLVGEVVFIFGPMTNRLRSSDRLIVAAQTELESLAHCDSLTGVANRAGFQRDLTRAARDQNGFSVVLCDLDRFKAVNDGFGHAAGDRLLVEMARRIRASVRDCDQVARLGGDEFAVLLPGLIEEASLARAIERIRRATSAPWRWGDSDLDVSSSVGGAICPLHSRDPDRLLAYADKALYAAKQHGRHQHIFDGQLRLQNDEETALLRDLGRALAEDEFELHYQPKVRIADGVVVGLEGLIRWRHPERGLLHPGRFLPVVMRGGRMVDMTRLVLEKAGADLARWRDSGRPAVPVAINMPEAMLANRLGADAIRTVLDRFSLPGSALTVEITEDVLVSRAADAIQAAIREIADLGVRVAFDDFGTGFASLIHLRTFRFDELKIDRSFIDEIGRNPLSEQIIRSIVSLARALEKEVVAEGVETEAQLRFLEAENCGIAQGYLFARPMAAIDLDRWMIGSATALLRRLLRSADGRGAATEGLDPSATAVPAALAKTA